MGGGADPAGLASANAARGIVTQAYSPLGGDAHAALLGAPAIASIAAAHNRSTAQVRMPSFQRHPLPPDRAPVPSGRPSLSGRAQVCLRWVLQRGHALATSTVNPAYMTEDLEAAAPDWALSAPQLAAIDALDVAPDDPVKAMCLL